ncbi:MAG: undecaprenyl-diphosphate phosphatase [Sulfurospirillum sp.]|nr:undecaprenyl-diphosphate phosphatase [Sulfurospirillum sp.]
MPWYEIVFLSFIQGFSEFLPISSSAHLILVPVIFGWDDQGLAFDVALHVGTLLAVLYYFKSDILQIFSDMYKSLKFRKAYEQSTLGWGVIIGTIPVGLVGLIFNDFISEQLRSPLVIASSTIIFALVLLLGDKFAGIKSEKNITIVLAVVIGIAQAVALIPGTSRSGITMSAAMLLGFSRVAAARFSFLLSIPVIVLAGGLKCLELLQSQIIVHWGELLSAVFLSGLSAYLCIVLFLRLISKSSMIPFVIYRFLLGIFLFYMFV